MRQGGERKPARGATPLGRIEGWGPYDVPGIGRRGVRVYVPRGHVERAVVVLFAGQSVLDGEGSFAGGWHAHRTAERIVTKKRAAPIVVGVDHGYGARQHELLPFAGRSRDGLDSMVAFLRGPLAHDVRTRFGISDEPRRGVVGGAPPAARGTGPVRWCRPCRGRGRTTCGPASAPPMSRGGGSSVAPRWAASR